MNRSTEAVFDEYLVLAAQSGSSDAFGRLAARWTPRLRRHAALVLRDSDAASDAVQEAWIGIARGLRRLDDPTRFPAWAFGITTRKCVDEVRRRQRRRALASSVTHEEAVAPGGGLRPADPDQTLDLSDALAALPIDQRLMVGLFYGEGLAVDEVAEALGIPTGTVKSRLHAIRLSLKTLLQGEDHVPA